MGKHTKNYGTSQCFSWEKKNKRNKRFYGHVRSFDAQSVKSHFQRLVFRLPREVIPDDVSYWHSADSLKDTTEMDPCCAPGQLRRTNRGPLCETPNLGLSMGHPQRNPAKDGLQGNIRKSRGPHFNGIFPWPPFVETLIDWFFVGSADTSWSNGW